jgi:hypothetical protein
MGTSGHLGSRWVPDSRTVRNTVTTSRTCNSKGNVLLHTRPPTKRATRIISPAGAGACSEPGQGTRPALRTITVALHNREGKLHAQERPRRPVVSIHRPSSMVCILNDESPESPGHRRCLRLLTEPQASRPKVPTKQRNPDGLATWPLGQTRRLPRLPPTPPRIQMSSLFLNWVLNSASLPMKTPLDGVPTPPQGSPQPTNPQAN